MTNGPKYQRRIVRKKEEGGSPASATMHGRRQGRARKDRGIDWGQGGGGMGLEIG